MLLSEAIRMGGLFGLQCRNVALRHMEDGSIQTCALGGAVLSSGISQGTGSIWGEHLAQLGRKFPALNSEAATDFIGWGVRRVRISRSLFHHISFELNDRLRLTRDQIADWIIANGHDCESLDAAVEEKADSPMETVGAS